MSSSIPNTTSATEYLFRGIVEGSRPNPPQSSGASAVPVESFHLYKGFREEQLSALRSMVRVFAMCGPDFPNLPKKQQDRMLEDFCEATGIPEATVAAERLLAAQDPVVQMVGASQIAELRRVHHDALNDVSLGEWLGSGGTEEDDQGVMWRKVAISNASQTPKSAAFGRPPAATQRGHGTAISQQLTRAAEDARKLQKDIQSLALQYVRQAEGPARNQLRQLLEEKKVALTNLRDIVERDDYAPDGASGRSTPA